MAFVRRHPYHAALSSFACGLGCAASAPRFAGLAAALGLAALAALRAPTLGLACAALVLVGAAIGHARLAAIDAAGRVAPGSGVHARAHLLERPRPSPFGSRAEVRIVSGRARGAVLLARAPRTLRWPGDLAVGAELRVHGFVRRPRERRGADFDFAAYLRRRGVAGELWLDSVEATGRRRGGSAGVFDAMRRRAERALESGMSSREAALARGMILGQDERIDPPTREDWRAAGLAHLLAVSGQNVTLLAALAAPLLAAAGLGLRRRALALLLLIAVYVPVAGAGPSLQRAGVMGAAGITAMALSRPASRWYALLLAAATTLALNPRSLTDPAWQLSFAAVMGILCLGAPLARVFGAAADALVPGRASAAPPRRTLTRAVADAAAITVAATVATAPLLGHHFGSIPVAGLPANLLALPAVVPAMWLGMTQAGLGQVTALGPPVEPPAEVLSTALGAVARVPVAYLAALAERVADVPHGQVALPLESPVSVLGAYGVLGLGSLAIGRIVRQLGPRAEEIAAAWRRRPPAKRAACALVLLVALGLGAARALAPPPPPGELTVRFLDVGQGDATLVQHPDGTALLFDGGPPEAGIARLLRAAGVRSLALVVATHASHDHHGGLREVLASYPVGTLLDGGDGTRHPGFLAVLADAARRGVRRARAVAPMTLRAGGLTLRVLSPPPRPAGPPPEDPNPRAVVAVVSAGRFDLLLSADAESESLLPLDLPDVEAMKVPHHGSADPGLPAVLERIEPEIAAIEVGPNTYGHPAPSTLAALERAGARTYRTDRDGTISLTVEGSAVRVRTEG